MTPYIYIAHDPIAMTEAQVTEFDQTLLKQAADAGIVFIRQDINGEREIVPYTDVVPVAAAEGDYTLVKPEYVDDRMNAVVDVFDALQSAVFPDTETATQSTTGVRRAARAITPEAAFKRALAALKEIVNGDDAE